jgi:large subunit ribosomal protein L24
VQTTLLGIGIAIIAALVAALVGPIFVDWGQYRAVIEAEAARVVGVPVRVAGAIDVRLLPTPSLKLSEVELGQAGSAQSLTAHRVQMEFSLGTLMRGEFHANQIALDRPEMFVGLDRSGTIQIPGLNFGFDPDRLAIERLTIDDGRLILADAASGTRLAIDRLNLSGEVISLIGPFKVEGSFTVDGERYAYRLSGSRRADDGGMKLRLAIDPAERALAFESDGMVWIESGSPRYEGVATLSRVVGTALPSGKVTVNDPWKITGKVKATAKTVLAEQLELLYGPESRLVRLSGSAIMNLGREPRIATTLTALQIDLDRVLPNSEQKRLPFETIRLLVDDLAAAPAPPLPIRISLGIDSLAAGGATLTAVRGDVENNAGGWNLDALEMRAPGATQMRITGRLALADRKVEFQGPVKVDSSDPAVFFAWIEGRSAVGRPAFGPMRGSGTVTIGGERVAVDGLKAEFDRKALEGRVAYRFATAAAPARLDAALSGAELDLDRGLALGTALFSSTSFERPGEIALALDIAHAAYGGVEARKAQAKLTYDHSGLKIERLSIADIGGASLDASGRIDNAFDAWRGSIAMSLAAPRLDGITMLADKFLPQASDVMHKFGARIAPLKLNAKLDMEPRPANAAGGRTAAKLKLDGTIAGIDVNLDANGTGDISDPAAAAVHIDGRFDAADGRSLANLVGLDALATADARPARITFRANGAATSSFKVDGRFVGNDVAASATGTVTPSGDGALDVSLRAANTTLPRRAGSAAVPADLRAHVAINGNEVTLTDLSGKVAGTTVRGGLTLNLGEPLQLNGRIDTDRVDAGELFAIFAGTPRPPTGSRAPEWVAEPFGPAVAPMLEGRVEFRVGAAQWIAGIATRDLVGAVKFQPSGFSLTDVTGLLADGRLALDAQVQRGRAGLSLQSHVKLTNADLPVLLAGALRVPGAGRISLEAELQGQGLSPASLVGSVQGAGTVTAENVEIAGLDPTAIDMVINALENDRGLAGNSVRVAQIANAGLDAGRLRIPVATAPIVIADGRAQLIKLSAPAQNADISGSISLALADWQLDARLAMTGPQRKNAPTAERPAMAVAVRGPLTAARRTADVANLIGWATMRAVDQEAKRLDDAEKERRRVEAAAEALRRLPDPAAAAPAQTGTLPSAPAPQASTSGRAPDLPGPIDIKPVAPPVRRAPPPAAPPKPFNLMESLPAGGR